MAVFKDYIKLTKQYQQEYGMRTVVLYQVGSFYELYSAGDDGINLKEITELINIQMTRKNKSLVEVSQTNYNMAGIPLYTLNKYLKILTNANYTVVVVDQSSDNSGPRKVAEIISPGTKLSDISPFDTNMIMVAHFDECKSRKSKSVLMCVGVCFLDLSSGKSYVGEFISTDNDSTLALDELYKFIVLYSPRELVFTSAGPLTNYSYDKLASYLDIGGTNSTKCIHNKLEQYPEQMAKNAYQDQLLRKVFPEHGLLSPHEFLNLEFKPNAALAFVYMLDFCYKHNERVLKNLSNPGELLPDTKYCTIAFNAANQLELNHLAKILNKCRTAIGRRGFRERIMSPLVCPDEINARYDRVAEFIGIADNEASETLIKCLDDIYDVERLYRLICLQKLHPADWAQILTTIQSIRRLNKLAPQTHFSKVGSARNLYDEIMATINMDVAHKYYLTNITENFFIKGAYPELDKLQVQFDKYKYIFSRLAQLSHPEFFKVEYTDRDGYFLHITKKRYDTIRPQLLKKGEIQIDDFKCSWADFEVKSNLTTLKCTCPALEKINRKIIETKDDLCRRITETYRELLCSISDKYKILFSKMIDFIGDMDWYYSCAKNVVENKYFRPTIREPEYGSSRSYLSAKDLRHPIIEQILTYEQYVPNDIEIGKAASGVLLYGVNSAGKSSLSKATAISIIMAQAGMYVPAELVYWPYKEVFTRIPSGDNMMKNQSTFVVEITELGNILRRCSKNSLIIGDELASGTEQISGVSIIGASIEKLCSRESSFIFATHLHDLTKISTVRNLVDIQQLDIFHLSVEYDEDGDKLIYNRKLMPGQGQSIYGLEVCRSIITDLDFMNCANQIRHEVIGESTKLCETKKSRYNAAVFVDACAICSKKAEEVHHIKLQKFADAKGFIGTVHKNHRSNLVPICEKCHDNIHNGKITVSGYLQTTKGVVLNIKS